MQESSAAKELGSFVDAARGFCELVESADVLGKGQFIWTTGERLAVLYAAGLALPRLAAMETEGSEDARPHDQARAALADRIRAKLGDLDDYRFVFDPYESHEPPVDGSLSDDLSDIYQDLKHGLDLYTGGVSQGDAIWEWRVGFETHWGVHAAHAQYAIHWITHKAGAQWISPDDP
jgi:hypothetical protein